MRRPRQGALKEGMSIAARTQIPTGTWHVDPAHSRTPPRHKMALLTWPGAWALITLILWVLGPAMDTWPLPLRTLVISVLMVVGLTWLVIPYLTRIFASWLAPTPQPQAASTAIREGTLVLRAR
jgi:antibiotic biosynthesis monooxygenase (ABM) superfamily enzyme